MKNILIVCNYKPGVGGISGQVEILQRKLREEGYTAEIFSTKASAWERLWMMFKLRREASDFEVLHIHCCSEWGFLPAVIGVKVGNRLGKRVVLTYHGGGGEKFFDKHPRMVRKYLTRTNVNIVLSGFLAKVFDKHQLPYVVIPNIIELDSSHIKERALVQPKFVCIRAHEELYNIPCILKAFQMVEKVIPDASLTLVGDGSLHGNLVQRANSMRIRNVVFVGRVDNSKIFDCLDQSDIMLSAPRIDNMPVSLIEAMNAGLLVISSRVGGVQYMIEDGVDGLLFESDNDSELAEKMLWSVQHQDEVKMMIERARQKVKRYQWNNVKDQLFSAYGIHS